MNRKIQGVSRLMQFSDCGCEELASTTEETPTPNEVKWAGVIGMEGELTGDGRFLEQGSMRWDAENPQPFRYVSEDNGGHDGAVTVGRIDSIERLDGGKLWGEGVIVLGSEEAHEALRKIESGEQTGVSMDMDDLSFEVRVAQELLEGADYSTGEPDENGRVTLFKGSPSDEVMMVTDARIRAATIVAIPAFADARISLVQEEVEQTLVASGKFETKPSSLAFENPKLTGPTALTVDETGRVFGHLATWDTCHISYSAAGQCVTAPRSATSYANFHTGVLETQEGNLSVGRLIVDTTHANQKLQSKAAAEHYDHTGAVAAYVRAGEDQYGIWVSGVLNPDASEAQRRALKTSPLSGDWRRINNNLELVAALSVNVPGFPIPRPTGLVASGALQSLVASGMIPPAKVAKPGTEGALSTNDLKYLKQLADRERRREMRARAEQLAFRAGIAKEDDHV